MKAYICVYRHPVPSRKDLLSAKVAGASNPAIRRFLDVYNDQNCYYDWGDDPSFFAASYMLGDVRRASWGVCRPDVRNYLNDGDYVVFFCAKEAGKPIWDYYYIGVGTVCHRLTRHIIWSDDQYALYRTFFNLLVRSSDSVLEHHEPFGDHEDWENRRNAPYWLFALDESRFNIVNPLHVATYTGTNGPFETWHSSRDQQVARLEAILFPKSASARRLRTTNTQRSHPQINLLRHLGAHTDLKVLRTHLMELANGSS
jgi:hypothetical protein